MTHADSAGAGLPSLKRTDVLRGVAAVEVFVSSTPLQGASTRKAASETCGRVERHATPLSWSREKDAVLLPVMPRTSEASPPDVHMAVGYFASFVGATD